MHFYIVDKMSILVLVSVKKTRLATNELIIIVNQASV